MAWCGRSWLQCSTHASRRSWASSIDANTLPFKNSARRVLCQRSTLPVVVGDRGVDIEDDLGGARRRRGTPPHLGADLGHGLPEPGQGRRVDAAERPVQRRIRRHRTEQSPLGTEAFDIRTGLPAAGQHQHRLHEDLPPVVERETLTSHQDASRQRITQPQPIGKSTKSVQADMGHDSAAAALHDHRHRAVNVHLAGALLDQVSDASRTSESLVRRAPPRIPALQLTKPGVG